MDPEGGESRACRRSLRQHEYPDSIFEMGFSFHPISFEMTFIMRWIIRYLKG